MKDKQKAPVLIIGAGNIGTAMAEGMAAAGEEVVVYNRTEAKLARFENRKGFKTTSELSAALASRPWLLLLCVETDAVGTLLSAMASKLAQTDIIIGSCAAVPTLADMRRALGDKVEQPALVRVLPNIAATRGKSVNLIAAEGLDEKAKSRLLKVLKYTGSSFEVPEQLFGAAMALSSCGIAFALRYVRAQVEAAVQLGLQPAQAALICGATLEGAAALLRDGTHPEALIDRVTTPGGLTIRGLNAMENDGFSRAVIASIVAAGS